VTAQVWPAELSASVIVPTYNRKERLARLLQSLERTAAAVPGLEVVVAVDGATDGTAEMLAGCSMPYRLRVLTQANAGPGAARNLAMRAADGDVLIFLDDDVTPSPGCIERHLAVHRHNDAAVVIGAMLPPPGYRMAPWLEWEAATLKTQYEAMLAGLYAPTPRQFFTANASVRRVHALAVTGFDETFRRAEDVEFAFRLRDAGLGFYFEPAASVTHEPDRSFTGWLRVPYEYGRADVRLCYEKGRRDLLGALQQETQGRHPLTRMVTRLCYRQPRRYAVARTGLATIGFVAGQMRMRRPAHIAYSALFTLAHSQGWATMTPAGGYLGLTPDRIVPGGTVAGGHKVSSL
jgi:GT2 family glycosyltransferase